MTLDMMELEESELLEGMIVWPDLIASQGL
jgi:hypothetical protein